MAQGQGHETTFAQIAADTLGTTLDAVTVVEGDTDALPYGMGSWGSRSAVMGGGAVLVAATRVREKADKIAAELGATTLAEVADVAWFHPHRLPPTIGPGLSSAVVYTPGNTVPEPDEHGHVNFDETFASYATAIAVEVDAETGVVSVLEALVVSDCGVVVNPAVVEGQHRGGFAQAIGAVLYEHAAYDADGQPRATSFADYLLPGAPEVPELRVVHRETPSAVAGGVRGVAEATITATPAALAGAIADALAPLGVDITSTRLAPADLWTLLFGRSVGP
jgi:carbon-monoxide dehydrogenase large subunit